MKETGVAYTIVVADRGNISVLAYEADEFTQMVQFVATPGRSLTILVWKTGEENDL